MPVWSPRYRRADAQSGAEGGVCLRHPTTHLTQGPALCRSRDPGLCPGRATSLPPWGLGGKGVAAWASVPCPAPGPTLASRCRSDQGWDLQVCHLNSPSTPNFLASEVPAPEGCGPRRGVKAPASGSPGRTRGLARLLSVFRKLEKRGASQAETPSPAFARLGFGFRFGFGFRPAGTGADRSRRAAGAAAAGRGLGVRRGPVRDTPPTPPPRPPQSRFPAGIRTERPHPPPGPGRQRGSREATWPGRGPRCRPTERTRRPVLGCGRGAAGPRVPGRTQGCAPSSSCPVGRARTTPKAW